MSLIPVPEKDLRVVGSVSKMRTSLMPLDLRSLMTEEGGGRLLATRP